MTKRQKRKAKKQDKTFRETLQSAADGMAKLSGVISSIVKS